ncbi:2-oxoglutarate and iron-dependent oxygenase domain-containing protein 2 isoform X3 [Syngnathoides biaculeatus]|uniref:2-oxoglutarate and iron-dependent oxygenase domain-containing protein 2 isoform X3 n=1 Tax=Syngnathoides biaculeatus TaxID=300417 RepID=UPI002ADDB006|nr:2-oxoglutarate and iron-dependent oxygenase domain-containing protein 2 isoform X3 [Syngnathoides biaculeatus]
MEPGTSELDQTPMTNEGKDKQQFYNCSCFTTDNIFLEDYKLHVRFVTEEQFRRDYVALLKRLGCVTEQQFGDLLSKISQEVDRRIHLARMSVDRTAIIKSTYRPLHPHVYHLQESFLAAEFKHIVENCQRRNVTLKNLSHLLEEETVFNKTFCQELMDELDNFECSTAPKGRPNTMNKYGILLNELGFDECFVTPLREHYLHPLTSLLYPDCGGHCLDSHKAFVVKYDINEDLDLSYHYDNAEVTLNVSLGRDFTEGNLYFGDMRQVALSDTECSEIEHRACQGILHRGQHMHGALPISSGQRWNLIIWMRSSQERNRLCPMCNRKPVLVEGKGFADGFTRASTALLADFCALT